MSTAVGNTQAARGIETQTGQPPVPIPHEPSTRGIGGRFIDTGLRQDPGVDQDVVPGRVEQMQGMVAGGVVELGEHRQLVLRVVEPESGDRIARGRAPGGIADRLEEGPGGIHTRVAQVEGGQRLTGGQEVVVGVDQPGEERPTVEVVLDRAGVIATNLRVWDRHPAPSSREPRMPLPKGAAGSR